MPPWTKTTLEKIKTSFTLMNDRTVATVIFMVAVLFFAQGLSIHGIEYRDDEIFYFNSAKEMFQTHNFLSPVYFGQDRFQKPILFYWCILLFYKLFGISWSAARFTSIVTASLTVVATWLMAKRLFNKLTASLSVLILATVPMFFRHAKNAVPDMTLNFFIVCAIGLLLVIFDNPKAKKYHYLFFISCALGFMIKGFASLIVPILMLIVYALISKRRDVLRAINFPLGLLVFLAISLPWFLYMTKVHGAGYMNYMLKTETLNRTVAVGAHNPVIQLLITFRNNFFFYLETIMSYFAPWSVFIFGAIPLSIRKIRQEADTRESFLFMLTWFLVVLGFFCLIAHRINHLILVLTTPFAVLVAVFLLAPFKQESMAFRILGGLRKFFAVLILLFGLLGMMFLKVLLLGQNPLWILAGFVFFIFAVFKMCGDKERHWLGFILGGFLLFCFSQATLLSDARLTAVSSFQAFAQTINKDTDTSSIIAVGSHDLHEKEFQVYFNRKIEKAATSDYNQTEQLLKTLFARDRRVYCLITKSDYERYRKDMPSNSLYVIGKDYIFRRRIAIDKGFFEALLKLDQARIKNYFMEEVYLLRKDA